VAVLTRLGSGWLVDRRCTNGIGELGALTLVSVGAFALLWMSAGSDLLFVTGTLVGFGAGWGWQGLIHFATVRSHPTAVASASGLVLTAIYIGMVFGPATTGFVAQHFSYTDAWLIAALSRPSRRSPHGGWLATQRSSDRRRRWARPSSRPAATRPTTTTRATRASS
jgi:MFS family permease